MQSFILLISEEKKYTFSSLSLSKKLHGPFFMEGVQLPQGYKGTKMRQFTFYH